MTPFGGQEIQFQGLQGLQRKLFTCAQEPARPYLKGRGLLSTLLSISQSSFQDRRCAHACRPPTLGSTGGGIGSRSGVWVRKAEPRAW